MHSNFFPSCGCAITAEELYKVDNTAMAEVLAEESTRRGEQAKTSVPPEEEMEEEEAGMEEGGEVDGEGDGKPSVELEEILKTYDSVQDATSLLGAEAAIEGEEERETGKGCTSRGSSGINNCLVCTCLAVLHTVSNECPVCCSA